MRKVLFTLSLSAVLLTGGLQFATTAYGGSCADACWNTYQSCTYSPEVCEARYNICLGRCGI